MSVTYNQDTSVLQAGQSFVLDLTVPRVSTPALGEKKPTGLITNETGCLLSITLSGGRNFNLPAGAWTKPFSVTPQDTKLNALVLSVLPNSPVNTFSLTIYNPTEEVIEPVALGNSPIGISGQVSTTAGKTLQDDTDLPNTIFVEATPTDQSVSSITLRNDASGFLQVLSANVIRKILNVVRGTSGATKAIIDIGDSGDTSITTFHGTIGADSIVPPVTLQAGTIPTGVKLTTINSDGGIITSDGSGDVTLNNGTGSTPHFQVTDAVNNDIAWMDIVGEQMRIVTIYRGGGGRVSFAIALNTNIASVAQGIVCGLRSAGGGNPGVTTWEGTFDPGVSAGEGDLWAPQ